MPITPNFSLFDSATRSMSSAVENAASSFAIGVGESVGTGTQLIGSTIDDMGAKVSAALNATTGKISELGNYLSQNVIGGIRGAFTTFTGRLSEVLQEAPNRLLDFIRRTFNGLQGGGGLSAHLLTVPRRVLQGQGVVAALTNRYDPRTGRYHNIVTNRFATMDTGRNERGALGNLTARVRQSIRTLAQRIRDALLMPFNAMTGLFRNAFGRLWARLHENIANLGHTIAEFLTGVWNTLAASVQTSARAGLNAAMTAIRTAVEAVPQIAIPITGMLGAAVGIAIRTVIMRVTAAIASAWGGLVAFAARAWAVARGALGRLFTFLGNVFDTARNWIRGVLTRISGAASGTVGAAGGIGTVIISSVKVLLGNLFQLITGALQIGVAGVAMGVFAKAVYEAAKSAQEFAKSALQLSSSSGRSFGQSAGLMFGGRVLGIAPESMQNAFGGNAAITRMKGAAFGVDPTNLAGVAAKFQSLMSGGMGSQMMAQSMLKTLGMDSPDFRNALMQRPSDIASQQNFQQNMLSRMGIGQNSLEKFAREVPLLLGRIGAAWDALKIKLATTALPMLERLGTAITDLVANNADAIADGIKVVAEWMFVKAPVMLADGLVNVMDIVVKALAWMIDAGEFLSNGIKVYGPIVVHAISGMFQAIGDTVSGWLDGFGDLLGTLTDRDNPLRQFVLWIARALDAIRDMAQHLFDAIASSPAAVALGFGDAASEMSSALQSVPNMERAAQRWMDSDPFQGGADIAHNVARGIRNTGNALADATNTYGMGAMNAFNEADPFGKGANFLRNTLKPAADTIYSAAVAFRQGVDTEASRKAQWESDMLKQAKEQTLQLKELAQQGKAMPESSDRVASYMLLRYAKESTAALRRRGS